MAVMATAEEKAEHGIHDSLSQLLQLRTKVPFGWF